MVYKNLLGLVGAVSLGLLVVGALSTLTLQTLTSPRQLSAIAVLAFVGAAMLAIAVAGSKSPGWLSNPYW
jgi:Na+/glutamate symporter